MTRQVPTRRTRTGRVVIAGAGAAIMLLAVCADWIGLGMPESGFGAEQIVMLLLGALILLTALLDRNLRVPRLLARPLIACISAYLALLVFEVILQWPRAPGERKNPYIGLRGMYRNDEQIGFRLTPAWRGFYDDGVVNVAYRINSRGHRDDEPREPAASATRIILMGDSFTFGSILNQSETIDKQAEGLTGGRVDAYNIGVAGYGPRAILETFRRCDWYQGHHAFYLFFSNDFRDDELGEEPTATVVDGYLVRTRREDGQPYTEEEARAEIRRRTKPWAPRKRRQLDIRSVLHLSAIRKRIRAAILRAPRLFESDLLRGDLAAYSQANVDKAAGLTKEMRALASDRGMSFHVVIVPTRGEAEHRRHARYTSSYIRTLREAGIHVIELLDRLSGDDYFSHDPHLTAEGAHKAAKAIVEALPAVRES